MKAAMSCLGGHSRAPSLEAPTYLHSCWEHVLSYVYHMFAQTPGTHAPQEHSMVCNLAWLLAQPVGACGLCAQAQLYVAEVQGLQYAAALAHAQAVHSQQQSQPQSPRAPVPAPPQQEPQAPPAVPLPPVVQPAPASAPALPPQQLQLQHMDALQQQALHRVQQQQVQVREGANRATCRLCLDFAGDGVLVRVLAPRGPA